MSFLKIDQEVLLLLCRHTFRASSCPSIATLALPWICIRVVDHGKVWARHALPNGPVIRPWILVLRAYLALNVVQRLPIVTVFDGSRPLWADTGLGILIEH